MDEFELTPEWLKELGAPDLAAVDDAHVHLLAFFQELLTPGRIRANNRWWELRDPRARVFLHERAVRKACGAVGRGTVLSVLGSAQERHWAVSEGNQGFHLLGEMPFLVLIQPGNVGGALRDSIVVVPYPGMQKLQYVNWDVLRAGSTEVRKKVVMVRPGTVLWASYRDADGVEQLLRPGTRLRLAAGNGVVDAKGRATTLKDDTQVELLRGPQARLLQATDVGGRAPLREGSKVELTDWSLVDVVGEAADHKGVRLELGGRILLDKDNLEGGDDTTVIDWGANLRSWLAPLARHESNRCAFLRRVIYVVLKDVVRGHREWRLLVGQHDTVLNGQIPHWANQRVPANISAELLAQHLHTLEEKDSLRDFLQGGYQLSVARGNVGTGAFPSNANTGAMSRALHGDRRFIDELVCSHPQYLTCQIGNYYADHRRKRPFEVTLEQYIPPYVMLEYGAPGEGSDWAGLPKPPKPKSPVPKRKSHKRSAAKPPKSRRSGAKASVPKRKPPKRSSPNPAKSQPRGTKSAAFTALDALVEAVLEKPDDAQPPAPPAPAVKDTGRGLSTADHFDDVEVDDKEPNDKEPNDKEPNDKEPNDKEPNDKEPNDKEPNDKEPNDKEPNDKETNS